MKLKQRQDWILPRDEAIPRLLDLHGGRLLGLGRQICGNAEEAEDLVQEVFMQAWRKWDQFDHRSDPVVWLFTIARRACQRMHRKRAGEPARLESLDELLPFGAPKIAIVPDESTAGPVDAEIHRERQAIVGEAIASLPEHFRMAIVLKDIVGFSVAETAAVLGVPPGTIKTRVHRARLKLRHALVAHLPARPLPPPAYPRQVCMDLLQAKQEAMDRGVDMPNADAIICARCEAVFATLDLNRELCGNLARGELPVALRHELLRQMQR